MGIGTCSLSSWLGSCEYRSCLGALGALLGAVGHASDPLGLMSSSWLLLAAFVGKPLPVLAPILVTFLINFWVLFWIVFWKCCLKAFWVQKLPRRRQGEAQRRQKVVLLLLFTMVSACCFFAAFRFLASSWCHFGVNLAS